MKLNCLSRQLLKISADKIEHPWQGLAEVCRTITAQRKGRVYFLGSYWPAQLAAAQSPAMVTPGTSVTVIGRQGITLLVDAAVL